MSITKQELVSWLINIYKQEIEKYSKIAEDARLGAISGENKQEGEYDTRAIEAGYIAGAQARRLSELKRDLTLLQTFMIPNFSKGSSVAIGALVEAEENGNLSTYFLTPVGGMIYESNQKKIHFISIHSPLGQSLMGLKEGDFFEIESPKGIRELEVLKIK